MPSLYTAGCIESGLVAVLGSRCIGLAPACAENEHDRSDEDRLDTENDRASGLARDSCAVARLDRRRALS